MKSTFITEKDKHGVDFYKEYPIFLKNLHTYLKLHHVIDETNNHLLHMENDSFNESIGWPSQRAYAMLDDSFSGTCEGFNETMCTNSILLWNPS